MNEPQAEARVNRLIDEPSPYLLQHARNPVDWHPWGDAAIELARREQKPIFLSIGYSTCYWCHVMERESFEDSATAAVMNGDFINIKVDREQRPDVDEIYMTACQVFTRMTTGRASGGWPLSVFIEPFSLKPFFVGTYFPPEPQGGRPSFVQVCQAMALAWKDQRPQVEEQANRIAEIVARSLEAGMSTRSLGQAQVDEAVDRLMGMHDTAHGGFGGAPKFPQPVFLELLVEAGWDRQPIRDAITFTLDRMATGGIYDQVGGGFHRYATDAKWLVPHFEKMLYDNGQLASVYAGSVERTGDAYHAAVLEETLDYVLREMTDERTGAFFSAQDAEVNHHEGENYLWTPAEIEQALEGAGLAADLPLALAAFGLDQGTNFQDPHHPELPPSNVLYLPMRPDAFAAANDMNAEETHAFFMRIIPVLYEARMQRDQPGLDDKIITGWNGLMIKGMADGGRVLQRQDYTAAAERAATYILEHMRDADGGLMRTAHGGTISIPAFLEDHAFMAQGLIALHDATNDPRWLEAAGEMVELARSRFWGDDGAWYDTREGQEDLFVRSRNLGDGAVPSGIGTMLLVMPAMAERTGESWYLDDFTSALTRLSGSFAANPVGSAYATMATARMLRQDPSRLPGEDASPPAPVKARLVPAELAVAPGEQATIDLVLEITEGFHINAREPGDEKLVGLDVQLIGATGLEARVGYPEGSLYRESIRIHDGTVSIPVTLQCTGPVSGDPEILVSWQACTDQVCMAPETVRLPIALDAKE